MNGQELKLGAQKVRYLAKRIAEFSFRKSVLRCEVHEDHILVKERRLDGKRGWANVSPLYSSRDLELYLEELEGCLSFAKAFGQNDSRGMWSAVKR